MVKSERRFLRKENSPVEAFITEEAWCSMDSAKIGMLPILTFFSYILRLFRMRIFKSDDQ